MGIQASATDKAVSTAWADRGVVCARLKILRRPEPIEEVFDDRDSRRSRPLTDDPR